MLLVARCVSGSGLGCTHWSEFVYAWHRAWPMVVVGLVLAAIVAGGGIRHPQFLWIAAGVVIATGVGFIAYYVSL